MGMTKAEAIGGAAHRNLADRRSGRTAQDVARLGMLLALATALHTFEAQLPALPIPGAKVGLANVVSLLALFAFGLREALLIVTLRQVAGSLFIGTFLSPAFFFGLAGGLLSVFAMQGVRWIVPKASPVTMSLVGAAAHNAGQLLVAWWLTAQPAVFIYLPYLLWFAVPAGAFIGRLMESLVPYLRSAGIWTEGMEESVPKRRHAEVGVALALALVGGVILYVGAAGPEEDFGGIPVAVVRVDGDEVMRLPLDAHARERIFARGGEMELEVHDGAIRVSHSNCRNQVCVRRGWIDSTKESIVCLPFHTVITIEGTHEDRFDDIDAISM